MGFGDFFDEPKFDFEKERKTFIDAVAPEISRFQSPFNTPHGPVNPCIAEPDTPIVSDPYIVLVRSAVR